MTARQSLEPDSAATADQRQAPAGRPGTLAGRIRRSFSDSAGSIVFTDLFAAAVPVIPFALFALATARIVSLTVTLVLLVILGIGWARVGHRQVLATVAQTVGIAAAAAAAGLVVGTLIS